MSEVKLEDPIYIYKDDPGPGKRVKNEIYIFKNLSRRWIGERFNCVHDKKPSICRECRGNGICIHNREKWSCKECMGSAICEHNKRRQICKKCKGGSLCIHDRQKRVCRECGGKEICIHDRQRYRCRDCNGKGICEHNKVKRICKQCKGSSICEHNKQRQVCIECEGVSICDHKKQRATCAKCDGSDICPHKLRKSTCRDCSFEDHPEWWCKKCTYVFIRNYPKYSPFCFNCYCHEYPEKKIVRRYMLKETYIHNLLIEKYPDIIHNKKISGGCSNRRPDWFIDLLTHSIIIE